MPKPANRNYAFAEAFIDELARSGLHHACICPGSRSTPLVIALARHSNIKTWVHLDERSAAFFALGMARALGEPVAVVCTSGTAAANFFPAVVEAHNARLPLLVLTADRPTELREWGTQQTMDQTRMYGSHAKWSVNMPTPEATPDLLRYVRATACRAIATALQPPTGAVHINFPFREPLEPQSVPADFPQQAFTTAQEAWEGREGSRAYLDVKSGQHIASQDQITSVAGLLHGAERGLIICGPQDDPEFPAAVSALADRLGFPVLADSLSQVRCGTHDRQLVVGNYDAFLRNDTLARELAPDIVLRFGAIPTSTAVLNYLQRHRQARQIVVHDGGWYDPLHTATDVIYGDASTFTLDLTAAVTGSAGTAWPRCWLAVADVTQAAIQDQLEGTDEMFEGKVFSDLAPLLPSNATVFAGNSMPVRDMDTFFPPTSQQIRFMANRGANGIDGVVSSAMGASAAVPDPLVLVLGDISFYHDMNGLLAARQHRLNATIIVLNNDGGGIFSFLPQANYSEFFERYFGTPHGLTFEAVASLYSIPYSRITSWQEFHTAVLQGIESSGTTIVEVPSQRPRNVELHQHIWSAVAEAVGPHVTERA